MGGARSNSRLRGVASGMSVERLGCTVVGILALLVLILFVVAGMVWAAVHVGGIGFLVGAPVYLRVANSASG